MRKSRFVSIKRVSMVHPKRPPRKPAATSASRESALFEFALEGSTEDFLLVQA